MSKRLDLQEMTKCTSSLDFLIKTQRGVTVVSGIWNLYDISKQTLDDVAQVRL